MRDDDWNITECTDQDGIRNVIWDDVQNRRFFLAELASICNGRLKEQFGYCADTVQAKEDLEGKFSVMEEIDQATAYIFKEVARIMMVTGTTGIKKVITGEEWGRG